MSTEPTDQERIAKRIARAGIASRRDAERMIAEGRVRLNGRVLDTPAVTVSPADRIEVDGKPVAAAERMRMWRYHKPTGLVTSARDEKGRPTVFDRLPAEMPRVMSIGRLDLTSEGLLLLTNDGELKRRLELPATGWLRRYRVRVHGTPTAAMLAPLERGLRIGEEAFQPMQVRLDTQQGSNAWLTIGLREGKNREIRRALDAVGLQVNRLIRVSYGPFQLGDLASGTVEEIKARVLADQLGRPGPGPGSGAPTRDGGTPATTRSRRGAKAAPPATKSPAKSAAKPAAKPSAKPSGKPAARPTGKPAGGRRRG